MCAGTVDEAVAISHCLSNIQWQTGRHKMAHSESVFVGIVGQILVISQPSSHAIERSLCGDTVELCPDNLIGTNTPAAPDNCCPQPQGTAPS